MPPEVSQDEQRRELIDRVLHSRQFRRSARLRDFLSYLSQHAGGDIHEQEIGTQVFGREEGYDTAMDTIVRVNAYDLRKRLAEYFSTDGRDEPVIIEIPKGSYGPVFTPRPQAKPAPEPAPEPAAAAALPPKRGRRRWLYWSGLMILAAACAWLAVDNARLRVASGGWAAQPNLSLLWSRILPAGQTAEVVIADSCLSIFQDLTRQPVGLQDYVNRTYLEMLSRPGLEPEFRRALDTIMSRRYTSMADVDILRRLFALSGPGGSRMNVYFARDFPAESMGSANLILLGSKRSNPWVGLYESQLNFQFENNDAADTSSVLNKAPRAGEKSRYTIAESSPSPMEAYGEVAFLPNTSHTGNVLIIQGTGMQGTDAAGKLATGEDSFAQVVKLVRPGGRGPLPHFEVLLKNRIVGGTVQGFQIIAWRSL
jgi:hypothetical protein